MNLFIMRHGDAKPHQTQDSMRELSDLGILEAQVMAKWLKVSEHNIEQIIASPYVRAQQTATYVKQIISSEADIQTLDTITPNGSAVEVHDYLDGLFATQQAENVLIISHMPLVSYLCCELTFDGQTPIFPTAAIAHIEYDKDKMKGELKSLISPDDFC